MISIEYMTIHYYYYSRIIVLIKLTLKKSNFYWFKLFYAHIDAYLQVTTARADAARNRYDRSHYWPSPGNPLERNSQCQADSCQFMSWQHLVESIRFQRWFSLMKSPSGSKADLVRNCLDKSSLNWACSLPSFVKWKYKREKTESHRKQIRMAACGDTRLFLRSRGSWRDQAERQRENRKDTDRLCH